MCSVIKYADYAIYVMVKRFHLQTDNIMTDDTNNYVTRLEEHYPRNIPFCKYMSCKLE